jgi:uncharacterized protein YjiS (DUF1127 family)
MEHTFSSTSPTSQTSQPQWLGQLRATFSIWQRNARTRRQLAALNDRLLSDAGISPSERRDELDKAFWH